MFGGFIGDGADCADNRTQWHVDLVRLGHAVEPGRLITSRVQPLVKSVGDNLSVFQFL